MQDWKICYPTHILIQFSSFCSCKSLITVQFLSQFKYKIYFMCKMHCFNICVTIIYLPYCKFVILGVSPITENEEETQLSRRNSLEVKAVNNSLKLLPRRKALEPYGILVRYIYILNYFLCICYCCSIHNLNFLFFFTRDQTLLQLVLLLSLNGLLYTLNLQDCTFCQHPFVVINEFP